MDAFLLANNNNNNNTSSDVDVDGTRSRTNGEDWNNNTAPTAEKIWITVDGGVQVTTNGPSGILTMSPEGDRVAKEYSVLNVDERVILTVRVIRRLLQSIAFEHCQSKLMSLRVTETKSLVKRLKMKDRQNPCLQKAVLEHTKHIRSMLHVTKSMRFLKGIEQ